jgi:glucan phosphoethanolaminetransferase (alkaline phosphatase superfamily)
MKQRMLKLKGMSLTECSTEFLRFFFFFLQSRLKKVSCTHRLCASGTPQSEQAAFIHTYCSISAIIYLNAPLLTSLSLTEAMAEQQAATFKLVLGKHRSHAVWMTWTTLTFSLQPLQPMLTNFLPSSTFPKHQYSR